MSEENHLFYKLSPKVVQRNYESMPTKARIKFLIKILITFFSVIGLIYYSSLLMDQFFGGRTVISMKVVSTLNNQKIPSFTICYPELLSMEKIAQKLPETRATYEKYLEFLQSSSKTIDDYSTKSILDLYYKNMSKTVQSYELTINEIFNLSIPYEEDSEAHPYYPINVYVEGHHHFKNGTSVESPTYDNTPLETSVFERNGKMRKCFTFFSQTQEIWREYNMDIKEINIEVHHNSKHCPKSKFTDNYIMFAMHSPNTIPQTLRLNNFIELNANHYIEITFSRWKNELLGPEYRTNCHKYDMDDNIYYKFRSDCINHCIQRRLNKCSAEKQIERNATYEKCLFPSDALWRRPAFILYKDIKLCRFWSRFAAYDCLYLNVGQIEVECGKHCPPDCVNRYYSYEVKKSSPKFDGFLHIKIVHDQYPDYATQHIPEMTFISFVSNFGGLLGMWLGLSALAILKFMLKIIYK